MYLKETGLVSNAISEVTELLKDLKNQPTPLIHRENAQRAYTGSIQRMHRDIYRGDIQTLYYREIHTDRHTDRHRE